MHALSWPIRLMSVRNIEGGSRCKGQWWLSAAIFICLVSGLQLFADDLSDAQEQFLSGQYSNVIDKGQKALARRPNDEEWALLLTKALVSTGRYPDARRVITDALGHDPDNLRLRWEARKVLLSNGETAPAAEMVESILRRVSTYPRSYRDAQSLLIFGQAALLRSADPKRVLDQLFDEAKKNQPRLPEVYLASGNLALDKHDFALAAKRFEEGLKQVPGNPELQYGLAQAYAPSDGGLTASALEAALDRNSNHVGSLLLLTDRTIDAEDYSGAEDLLDRIKVINPWEPDAWAYRAVLAHLQNQPQVETNARETALKFWPTNPRVDYLIGQKLSQKYRFAEGSAHQRQALQFDQEYVPAKAQLASDLLRLGEENEGWGLAQEVQKQDPYDVEAYNLANLHDTMKKYATITNGDFVLRMTSREAAIYGPRALELLTNARSNLCAKYGIEVKRPTIVEIFAEQKDFAVRTFGMPGNPGYLGVCFGNVVTANSPAARMGQPVNWNAVLWHEFCHVVTLQLTRNKMPRWLSEGISVYEELQANPTWGQRMTPQYREMVLDGELTPIANLSGAFLSPRSEIHLQFAYYESCLVVEYLVNHYGLEQLKGILHDLGDGGEINRTIETHTAPMAELQEGFAVFARERANQLGPTLDWEKPKFDKVAAKVRRGARPVPSVKKDTPEEPATNSVVKEVETKPNSEGLWEEWARNRPTNFWVMSRRAQQFVEEKKWSEAKPILERLRDQCPDLVGPDGVDSLLAATDRALGETNAERAVLLKLAEKDDGAIDAFNRLMDLAMKEQDWPVAALNAQRYLAVNPLAAPPYRALAQASSKIGDLQTSIGAFRSLLGLDPPDPADVNFHLAEILHKAGNPDARHHVLLALEEAPRYRDALRLLLEINGDSSESGPATSGPATVKP
jgi:tetratricopeptide (TPR) repeat protein